MKSMDQRSFGAVATVFLRECRKRVFEQRVKVDEEFAHDGGESDFGRFAVRTKAVVEKLENGIVARGYEGRHVEGNASRGASAVDMAFAFAFAAVIGKGSQASEGSDAVFGQGTQFRHGSEQCHGGSGPDAFDLGQESDFGAQVGGSVDRLDELSIDLGDLVGQEAYAIADGGSSDGVGAVKTVFFGHAGSDELTAAGAQSAQLLGLRIRRNNGAQLGSGASIGAEHASIDSVGFGQLALGFGVLASALSVNHVDGQRELMAELDQKSLAASGAFADNAKVALEAELFEKLGEGGTRVGDTLGYTWDLAMEIEVILADIDAEVKDLVDGGRVHG
jgi:hypothetical protein